VKARVIGAEHVEGSDNGAVKVLLNEFGNLLSALNVEVHLLLAFLGDPLIDVVVVVPQEAGLNFVVAVNAQLLPAVEVVAHVLVLFAVVEGADSLLIAVLFVHVVLIGVVVITVVVAFVLVAPVVILVDVLFPVLVFPRVFHPVDLIFAVILAKVNHTRVNISEELNAFAQVNTLGLFEILPVVFAFTIFSVANVDTVFISPVLGDIVLVPETVLRLLPFNV